MNRPSVQSTVGAVVVTWNSSRDIRKCLNSLIAQTHHIAKIIVVDNHSSDNSADQVREYGESVELIPNTVNKGFAAANNQAIKRLKTDWILTLNPDAWIEDNFVECLLNFATDKDHIGALGGKLLQSDSVKRGKPQIDSLGIEIFRSRRVRDLAMRLPENAAPNHPFRVFGICAAAALYRRDMLVNTMIDGEVFPEAFFSYYEDADLAWRCWRRGWQAWTVPDAVGYHRRGGSPTGSRFSRTLTHRNRLWLVARNESPMATMADLPDLIAHETLMLARMMRYPYLFRASFAALMGLKQARNCRRELPSTSIEPPPFQPGIGFSPCRMALHEAIIDNTAS